MTEQREGTTAPKLLFLLRDAIDSAWTAGHLGQNHDGHEAARKLADAVAALAPPSGEGVEPVATVATLINPELADKDSGPFFSAQDWAALRHLPAGTKLYTTPPPASQERGGDMRSLDAAEQAKPVSERIARGPAHPDSEQEQWSEPRFTSEAEQAKPDGLDAAFETINTSQAFTVEGLNKALDKADECHCPQHGSWIAAEDIHRMVRDLDVAMFGKGAAIQAKLIDLMPHLLIRIGAYNEQSKVAEQAQAGELPTLPNPERCIAYACAHRNFYTADQMREYANAALRSRLAGGVTVNESFAVNVNTNGLCNNPTAFRL